MGDKASPKAGGVGRIYVDDIRVGRLGSSDPGVGVASYALENAATDGSGNGHDGTIVGAPVFIDGPAGMGKAVQFDGGGRPVRQHRRLEPLGCDGSAQRFALGQVGGPTTFYQGLIGKRDTWADR